MRTAIAIAAAALLATGAQAVTLVNGSFELGVNPGAGFSSEGAGSTDITGWTVGGGGVDYIGGLWTASNGTRSIDLSLGSAGSLSQAITGLAAGSRYRVTFDQSGNPDGADEVKSLVAAIAGGPSVQFDYSVTAANSRSNMLWTARTFDFVASSGSQVLSFTGLNNSAFGPALDNVSVGIVPEPAAWALMIAGFGFVGAAARRRRVVIVAA